mmetsp:Transcript_8527/g.23900  ORF Transcript_8527/g.23900 Transcript_8527/m.23900 type:complete len:361 (+) Transcript_8527:206-1288(+)
MIILGFCKRAHVPAMVGTTTMFGLSLFLFCLRKINRPSTRTYIYQINAMGHDRDNLDPSYRFINKTTPIPIARNCVVGLLGLHTTCSRRNIFIDNVTTKKYDLPFSEQENKDIFKCASRYRMGHTDAAPSNDLLQVIHLRQALQEECKKVTRYDASSFRTTDFAITVNHKKAISRINGQCSVGIIFPRTLVNYCACGVLTNHNRSMLHFFSGTMTGARKESWLGHYIHRSTIVADGRKRDVRKTTGIYDYEYYDSLMDTRFALVPDGDFPWTYRFLESIMCGAIPVVGQRSEPLSQEYGYKYCIAVRKKEGEGITNNTMSSDCLLYGNEMARKQAALDNWIYFIRHHSFIEDREWIGHVG